MIVIAEMGAMIKLLVMQLMDKILHDLVDTILCGGSCVILSINSNQSFSDSYKVVVRVLVQIVRAL